MKLTRTERVAAFIAGGTVSVGALLGVYTLSGPVLSSPVVLTIPDAMMNVVGDRTVGYYSASLPDFIFMTPEGAAHAATLPHEVLHYENPTWSECEVSDHLFETTGLADGYHVGGKC